MTGWVERRRMTGRKAEYSSINSKSDARGWRVCAHIAIDYNRMDAPYVEAWQEDAQGNQHNLSTYPMPSEGGKTLRADGLGLMVAGPNVHLICGAHEDSTDTNRDAIELEIVLPNWYTPWPGQGMAGEPEGAVTFIPQGGQNVEIDYDLVAEKVIALLKVEMGGEIRQVLEDKAKDAVKELNMWSPSMQTRGVDQWVRDRMYQCLVENGLIDEVDVP